MVSFSKFEHKQALFPCEVPLSKDYKVYINGQEIPTMVAIANERFREMDIYADVGLEKPRDIADIPKDEFASVRDVQFKDIFLYADEKVMELAGTQCAIARVWNCLESTKYKNITIENVVVNGQRLDEKQMFIDVRGVDRKELIVK